MAIEKLFTTELARLDKFSGTNYKMWNRKIRYALIYDNLKYVITIDPLKINDDGSEVEIRKLEKWNMENEKAKSLMLMFMEDSLIKYFKTYKTRFLKCFEREV
jgi:hypothetical protein